MKAIILAADYATRLYPLTNSQSKPLLEVGDKSILDHIIEKMDQVEALDEVFIVMNEKFSTQFTDWSEQVNYRVKLTVVNCGTLSKETGLGAIGDIQFVIDKKEVNDDLMIVAGDNLFGFELTDFVEFYNENKKILLVCIGKKIQRGGTADIDTEGKIIGFE